MYEDDELQGDSMFVEAARNIAEGRASGIPSYLVAADTLSTANGNKTFVESAAETVDNVQKFIGLSVLSAGVQAFNVIPTIGNLVGGSYENIDVEEAVATLESDELDEFYARNQEGVDLVGFIAGSIPSGIGGVKLLNAGQSALRGAITSGRISSPLGRSFGLLAPENKKLLAAAVEEVSTNASVASLTNRTALKAVSAGAGQNVLEAIAFETAVAATMFNSPVLENQDFGDLVSNIAFSAGIFGVFGGAIDATKLSFAMRGARNQAAQEAKPWQFIEAYPAATNSYEKIAMDYEQLASIPPVPKDLAPSRISYLEAAAKTKATTLENQIRKEMGVLANGDQMVAETMFRALKGTSLMDQQSLMIGMVAPSRLAVTPKVLARQEYLGKRVASGKATLEETAEFHTSSVQAAYVKVWGDGAGKVSAEAPRALTLVDTLKAGQKIEVSGNKVRAGDQVFKFNSPTAKKSLPKASKKGEPITDADIAAAAKKDPANWSILRNSPVEVNARYIWAQTLKLNPAKGKEVRVHVEDIPLLEQVMLQVPAEQMQHVKFVGLPKGVGEDFVENLPEFVASQKMSLANKMLNKKGAKADAAGKPVPQEEIANAVNIRTSVLNGIVKDEPLLPLHRDDMLALQSYQREYNESLISKGFREASEPEIPIWSVPQNLKLTYDLKAPGQTKPLEGINNFVVENMAIIKEQQKLYQADAQRAAAQVLGRDFDALEDIKGGYEGHVFSKANPSGAGAGLLGAASQNYGSLAASVAQIGQTTGRIITKFQAAATDALEPVMHKLARNQKAAIEWSVLNQRTRAIPSQYALHESGEYLEPLALQRARAAAADAGEEVFDEASWIQKFQAKNPGADLQIPLQNQEVRDLVKAHIELNGKRTRGLAGIRTAQGVQFNRAPEAFYPLPVDPRDYKHFALVTDKSITSGNHSKTLFASSAEELDQMIRKLKENPHLEIRTKREAEEYFDARGRWDYEKTLSSNYLDTEAQRKGVSSSFFVPTDPEKVIQDTLKWHMDRESGLVREAVSAKYEVAFEELKRLGAEFTNVETSKFGTYALNEFADDIVKNPYIDYIKTALNLRKTADYPMLTAVNKLADEAFSKMWKKVDSVREKAKTADELKEINGILKEYGYKGAAYDESMDLFANAGPARGALAGLVQKANAVLATTILRWDVFNAVNNAVSANVLLGAEAKAVIGAIERGDSNAVGALAELAKIKVPGTDKLMLAPQKLIANSIRKFNRQGENFKFYEDNGFMTRISDQYRNIMDDIAYRGAADTVETWGARLNGIPNKLRAAGDKGEVLTGNRLAEEFNRFVAADVMKQLTDIAVANKLMTPKESLAYINTFVNRTQGNYQAAQRPMLFQGPIGQAIGLFQTYQFNLMQQLLRHVGEGPSKDAMTLLGLQGTIHGMNGLPAFHALNQHLIGNASGNTAHRDIYDTTYGIVGKEAGDWLMYGFGSNALGLLHPDLKTNLYVRGDINPRTPIGIPTNPADIPIVQASTKFFKNLFTTADGIMDGGDVSTVLLRGLEHNAISRPLAGIAQTLQGLNNPEQASYSTSKKGNVIAANDLLSLANLGRVLGGKPMDEAIAIDATYRFKAYGLKDYAKRQELGMAIKSTVQAGQFPSQEEIEEFAQKYAEAGGKSEQFNQWFTQLYKTANSSQANEIQKSLSSPFTQSMQKIMGGRTLKDFSEE